MIEAKLLHGFLDRLTLEAMEEIEKGGSLNQQNALPFLIKDQYSKISRIEEEFVTDGDFVDFKQYCVFNFDDIKKRFEEVDKRFEEVDKRFEALENRMNEKFKIVYWMIGIGYSLNLMTLGLVINILIKLQ